MPYENQNLNYSVHLINHLEWSIERIEFENQTDAVESFRLSDIDDSPVCFVLYGCIHGFNKQEGTSLFQRHQQ